LILDNAEFEEVPQTSTADETTTTVEAQAVPGELQDPTAVAEEESEDESKEE
jgi:hypothetical protein